MTSRSSRHISQAAARTSELLTNVSLHEKMAAAARATALSRFCTKKLIPKYEQYYEEVLARS